MCSDCSLGYHTTNGTQHSGVRACCSDIYCRIKEKERMVFETKDSGDRVEYDSGMVRDTNGGKPRFDLMIPKGIPFEELYLTRVARLYERGAQKYTERNWEKSNSQEELDRALESAFRHFMQWFAGETDEDHAAAVFFNINEVETIKTKLSSEEIILREFDAENERTK